MKRLFVDMDGVLANVYEQFILFEQQHTGRTKRMEELSGLLEREAFPNHDLYVHSDNFFLDAKPMAGSPEVLSRLNDQYDLYIVSSAMEFPPSLLQKKRWLEIHFPFIHWKQIILCGSKDFLVGDILIDDHFKNLDPFQGTTLLFTQPHNIGREVGRHLRVDDWQAIGELLWKV
ncbi:MAG: hypothetical protein LWW85_00750 [Marinilabiliales bacterium]|nr:hypothetical protein [Marinilabiliales bacterium]